MTSERYIPEPGDLYTMLRRMENRNLVTSKWEKKEAGVDRRVYTLTEDGVRVLKEGIEMTKRRRQLMDNLAQFYDDHFMKTSEGGDT